MSTEENKEIKELEAKLSRLKNNLSEVEEERQFVLGQTGLHVPGVTQKKYDAEIRELTALIDDTQMLIIKSKLDNVSYTGRYVCTCMKVSLKDIENEILSGARSFREIHQKTKCGGKCGACIDNIKGIVQSVLE